VVKMSMLVFWVVKPCRLVGRYLRFGGTYCLHLRTELSLSLSMETVHHVLQYVCMQLSDSENINIIIIRFNHKSSEVMSKLSR
jgi:hypothetical protein